jgi:hypothetical protein
VPSLASLVTAITATVGQGSSNVTTSVTPPADNQSSGSALGQFVSAVVSASLPLLATATPSSVAKLTAALAQDQALSPLLAAGSSATETSLAAWLQAAQRATAGYLTSGPEAEVSQITWGVARLARAAALLAPLDKHQASGTFTKEHGSALLLAARSVVDPSWRAALAQRVGPQKPGGCLVSLCEKGCVLCLFMRSLSVIQVTWWDGCAGCLPTNDHVKDTS